MVANIRIASSDWRKVQITLETVLSTNIKDQLTIEEYGYINITLDSLVKLEDAIGMHSNYTLVFPTEQAAAIIHSIDLFLIDISDNSLISGDLFSTVYTHLTDITRRIAKSCK